MKRTVLMLMLCSICVVSLTYSWFTSVSYHGGSALYRKNLIIGGGTVRIENYHGEMVDNGNSHINYTLIEGGIEVDGVSPGSKQFFKTVIYNDTENDMTLSVLLPSVVFDPELTSYISIVATNPYYIKTDMTEAQDYEDSINNHLYRIIYGVMLGDRISIKKYSSFTIVWHIAIDEETPNFCMGKRIKINGVQTTS